MNPELLEYFHRELQFLAHQGPEFARQHPDVAPLLETPMRPEADPHVERMIQAFAWLNARVHLQMDSQLPEIAEAFFSVVFPHAQRPFPACAVVQMTPKFPDRLPSSGLIVPRGTFLESEPVAGGLRCRFQTVFPVVLNEMELVDARYQPLKPDMAPSSFPSARSVLRLDLHSRAPRGVIRLDPLRGVRLFLKAPRGTAFPLYELLVRDAVGISVRDDEGHRVDQPGRGLITGVGFGADESLLPQHARSPAGQLLIQEFFAFPEKFLFVDVAGLPVFQDTEFAGSATLSIYFHRRSRELEPLISVNTIRLDCTPVVNLFAGRAEPVPLTHERSEYLVRPDARFPKWVEVHSIDRVNAVSADRTVRIREFYEPHRPTDLNSSAAAWMLRRRPGTNGSDRAQVVLGLADPTGEFLDLDKWTLDLEVTCLNGDLPAALPYHGAGPPLQLVEESGIDVDCIVPPTRRLDPPLARQGHGKLVALLALQSLPLFCENAPVEFRLREYLGCWNPNPSRETLAFVESLNDARARQSLDEVWVGAARCFARGVEVVLELDESRLPGRSACLYSCVLEHFLSLTSSLNCFTRLIVQSAETRNVLHRSVVRAGDQVLASLEVSEPSIPEWAARWSP